MNTIATNLPNEGTKMRMNPMRFSLWLFLISIAMMFISLSSAYIVKKSSMMPISFSLPSAFDLTMVIIIISSFTLQYAYMMAKKDELLRLKIFVIITFVLGIMFMAGQWLGWTQLVDQSVYWVGHPLGSFIYVFSGLHGVHIIGGLIFIILVLVDIFKYQVHSKKLLKLELCVTFWHFLGALWIYLYLFLKWNH